MADNATPDAEASDQLAEWLETSTAPEVVMFRKSLEGVSDDQQAVVMRTVAALLISSSREFVEQLRYMEKDLARLLYKPHRITPSNTEMLLFKWLRNQTRANEPMNAGLLDHFLNRLCDPALMHVVDSYHVRVLPMASRVRLVADRMGQRWGNRSMIREQLLDWLMPNKYNEEICDHVRHYVVLFLEAYADGVIPGMRLESYAIDAKERSTRWGNLMSHPVYE